MTEWFEEDEPVYTHPRDPYSRVDILASSRHVRVELDGVTVADSHQPRILFETGLPPRYYLPLTDVRMDLLRPSATQTHCPYKGTASYWSVTAGGERAPRHRVDLPHPAAGKPEDRRAGLLLRREGGRVPGRGAAGAAAHPLQLTPAAAAPWPGASSSSIRAVLGPRRAEIARAAASASASTRRMLPPASLAQSASDQPRPQSSAISAG